MVFHLGSRGNRGNRSLRTRADRALPRVRGMGLPFIKSFRRVPVWFAWAILATLGSPFSTAFGQGTAFVYQGRLNVDGARGEGVYDFAFQAFDAATAGTSIGGIASVNGVAVTNGLFVALVDLGGAPFTGPPRWLQISVSTNGAGNFATLTPRQPLTPSPYAIYARAAGTVTNLAIGTAQLAAGSIAPGNIQESTITAGQIAPGQVVKSLNGLTDAASLSQGANISINALGNSLQISGPAPGLNLPYSGSGSNSASLFTLTNSGTGPAGVFLGEVGAGTSIPAFPLDVTGAVRITSTGPGAEVLNLGTERNWAFRQLNSGAVTALELASIGGGGNKNFVINIPGFVGIGTNTPISKLVVRGDIHLGESGELSAVGGEENLRIIRGMVYFPQFSQPTIAGGTGFSVIRPTSERSYLITFTTPFSGQPAVTVTVNQGTTVQRIFGVSRNVTPTQAGVVLAGVGDPNPEGTDRTFEFIAVGPR
jgi:hypothetical protein